VAFARNVGRINVADLCNGLEREGAATKWGGPNGKARDDRCVRWDREIWYRQLVCSGEPAGWEVSEVEREARSGWVMLCVY